jgi:hypothetical protein
MTRIPAFVFSVLVLFVPWVAGADKSDTSKPASYQGQQTINTALRNLTNAQKLAKGTSEEVAKAIDHLNKAEFALRKDRGNKHGSFKETAHRLSGQAAKDLAKGLTDKALHNIEEAIEAAHKAGKAKEN